MEALSFSGEEKKIAIFHNNSWYVSIEEYDRVRGLMDSLIDKKIEEHRELIDLMSVKPSPVKLTVKKGGLYGK